MAEPAPPTGDGIGVDVGVLHQVATSDGAVQPGRKVDRRRLKRLARRMASLRQKALASGRAEWVGAGRRWRCRWIGGPSRRYAAFRQAHAREWERVTELERNAAHRMTADIIGRLSPGDTISVEDLRIQNMLRNHHLARAIGEQGWARITQQLEYKAERAGLRYVRVDPASHVPGLQRVRGSSAQGFVRAGPRARRGTRPENGPNRRQAPQAEPPGLGTMGGASVKTQMPRG